MGFARKFENRMEDSFESAANRMSNAPISPVKIAKKAEKQMQREKMVGAGKQYAPTLYTVLVNANDDSRLFGYYPTLAGETETYLAAKAEEKGFIMDGQPLVRFIADDTLKPGKFDVIAEAVAAPVIEQLRMEEMQRYGISQSPSPYQQNQYQQNQQDFSQQRIWNPDYYDVQKRAVGVQDEGYAEESRLDAGFNGSFGSSRYDAAEADLQRAPSYNDLWDDQPAQPLQSESQSADLASTPAQKPAPSPQAASQVASQVAPHPAPHVASAVAAPATMVMDAAYQNAPAAGTQRPSFAKLVNISTGQTHIIRSSRSVLGRGTSCDVMLADLKASRTHAEIRHEPQGFWSLTDLNSTNGTIVNGRRVSSTPLQEGDVITIGISNFAFSLR